MSVKFGDSIVTKGLVLYLNAASQKNYVLSEVEVLVVAGGGAGGGYGGNDGSGGGGAGGLLYSSSYSVTPGSAITATVGNGGAGVGGAVRGSNGQNSVFGILTTIGGGGGGTEGADRVGKDGGSGGGAGGYGIKPGGLGTAGQGFAGGDCTGPGDGGGGGAGAVGKNGLTGTGGIGLLFNISGTPTYYAGGGGASGDKRNVRGGSGSLGGFGGGGKGQDATNSTPPVNGTNGLGGGGGAAAGSTATYGAGTTLTSGAGGSGIVIVRYSGPQKATGGNTITNVGGYTIHTFTASGTFTPLAAPANAGAIYGLQDLSGNNNTGTQSGGVTYNSANGGALNFDGVNDVVTLTGTESFNFGTGDFTIEFWVYFNNINTQQLFISKYLAWGNNADFLFRLTLGGPAKIKVYYSPFTFIADSSVIAPSIWYHICVSRISNTTTFYTNGSSTGTHTGSISITNNKNTLRLGLSDDNDEPLNGRISNVKIYNRALTAAEVLQNYNATKGRFGL